jgi:hypothetical protein
MPENSHNSLDMFIADVVDRNRPQEQPPFDELAARWRRRRAIRRSSAVAAVALVVAALAVPVVLFDRLAGRNSRPSAGNDVPSPVDSRPIGRIPWEVTSVSACRGEDCRTLTDPQHVRLLVDDLNASQPYPYEYYKCPASYVITMTFTGPQGPYPIIDLVADCDFWTVRGESQRYEGWGQTRESAQQAQLLGVVVHDCFVTRSSYTSENSAAEFVGLTLDEALSQAAQRRMTVRVFGQDGKCTGDVITDDYRLNRVNLYLEHGRVVTAARY